MEILQACPNLVGCTFDHIFYDEDDKPEAHVWTCMRHLKFGTYPHPSSELALQYMSTPQLEVLHFPAFGSNANVLLDFLKRSSRPLKKLMLGGPKFRVSWTRQQLEECFSLLPNLTHVELNHPGHEASDPFTTILANSPHLVPNLSRITLRQPTLSMPWLRWYQKLVAALLCRETMYFVRIVYYDKVSTPRLTEAICFALRQLVAGGMKIHIGTEVHNYI
ncbi:hypothetical protein B0H17DRAFT_1212961 [Mycena rosella]|uniref:F-box domain-containing protein n=1 Tax=Mycena rosella TaxID=1033263 RepID=A0AAD7CQX8_MYCRO|nr:hypothetical protein B0H17DRAFT_1212961 [Mycena rosella]